MPPVRQRARFGATYELESDDPSYGLQGSVNLAHADVSITRTNLVLLGAGVDVHHGAAAGAASFAILLRAESATLSVTISDTALPLSAVSPSLSSQTLVTTLTIAVEPTYSGTASGLGGGGPGGSCMYTDTHVRSGALGLNVPDVATFAVDSDYGALMDVDSNGVLTANTSHWAKAPVEVTNRCVPTSSSSVALSVNMVAGPGQLDLGQSSLAPLQPGSQLHVPLWVDLSATYSSVCAGEPITVLFAQLFYRASELESVSVSSDWRPGGSPPRVVSLVAKPNDAPSANSAGYDRWSNLLWGDFVGAGFTGRSWSLLKIGAVLFNVVSGTTSGQIGVRLEVTCGGVAHMLPSSTALHDMQFTSSWATILPPPSRRRLTESTEVFLGSAALPLSMREDGAAVQRRLQTGVASVHGDVTGDGLVNGVDMQQMVEWTRVPLLDVPSCPRPAYCRRTRRPPMGRCQPRRQLYQFG